MNSLTDFGVIFGVTASTIGVEVTSPSIAKSSPGRSPVLQQDLVRDVRVRCEDAGCSLRGSERNTLDADPAASADAVLDHHRLLPELESLSPTRRTVMLPAPPGREVTMSSTAFAGYACAARALRRRSPVPREESSSPCRHSKMVHTREEGMKCETSSVLRSRAAAPIRRAPSRRPDHQRCASWSARTQGSATDTVGPHARRQARGAARAGVIVENRPGAAPPSAPRWWRRR